MKKKEIRTDFIARRQALTAKQCAINDDLILIQWQRLPLPDIQCIFSFYPNKEKREPNIFPCLDFLQFRQPELQLCFPVTTLDHQMEARLVNDDTDFQLNRWGIPEPTSGPIVAPEAIDAVFVPLLAFDRKGYRVGYGKGYYDRFLDQCSSSAIKIGFSYFPPIDHIADTDRFDIPLTHVITPNEIYTF